MCGRGWTLVDWVSRLPVRGEKGWEGLVALALALLLAGAGLGSSGRTR